MNTRMGTGLDHLLGSAVDAVDELERLETSPKQSARGMLKDALAQADMEEDQIRELGERLDGQSGTDNARRLLRQLIAFIRSRHCSNCPKDPGQLARVYGSEEAAGEMAIVGANAASMLALAVLRATESSPEDFGQVDEFDKYQLRTKELRDGLDDLYHRMEGAVTGEDLVYRWDALTPDERQRGLARICFKRAPEVLLVSGWPKDLVAAIRRQMANGQKPKTRKVHEPKRKGIKRRTLAA